MSGDAELPAVDHWIAFPGSQMNGFRRLFRVFFVLSVGVVALPGLTFGSLPPVLNEEAQLNPSDPGNATSFGVSTAIDGNRAAVVRWGFSNSPSTFYLYDHTTGEQSSKVAISQSSNADRFTEVDISADLLLVGSQEEMVNGVDMAGRALLFDIGNPAQPTELLQLTAPVVADSKNFGAQIELEGRKALVGAYGGSSPLPAVPGAAYYYDLTDLNSVQVTTLVPDDSRLGDLFGISLAMDGDVAIIGGFSGKAYMFDLSSGNQLSKIQSPSANYTAFGQSVDISGDRAIVWSRQNNAGDDNGAAHLYDVSDPANPVFLKTLTGSQPLLEKGFMGRVAIDGDYAALSARSANSAYLFDISDLNNISETRLVATNIDPSAEFGISLDIDGSNIIVGAWSQRVLGQRSGAAYVFRVPEPKTSLLLWPLLLATLRRAQQPPLGMRRSADVTANSQSSAVRSTVGNMRLRKSHNRCDAPKHLQGWRP